MNCAEQVVAWVCDATIRFRTTSRAHCDACCRRWHCISGRAHIFGFTCLGFVVSLAGHVSISWIVVSALCVCDQPNFHNCTKCVDRFSMLRTRSLNFEPHQGTRMGVPMCFNVLNFSLRTSSLLVLTLSLRRRARKHFKCTVRTDISHLTGHMCERV